MLMTDQGESVTPKGELKPELNFQVHAAEISCSCCFVTGKNCSENGKEHLLENWVNEKDKDCYELFTRDIHFWYGKMYHDGNKSVHIHNQHSFLQMTFAIKCNSLHMTGKEKRPLINLGQYQHNLLLVPAEELHLEFQREGLHEAVTINMATDFFFRFLPTSLPQYATFKKSLEKKKSALLSSRNLMINPKIMAILYEILHCPHKGCFKRLFVESKVIELLTIQLEQNENQEAISNHKSDLRKDEIEKMHMAREIVLLNIEKPLSLSELARRAGTNEFNLKKHFKQVYGTTVFGFIHTYRMERAKQLLKNGEMKIAEIAKSTGYQHPTHFTAAFKRYYGYLPNKIRG
jgi:AraC-like DNA-binding protein